MSASLVYLSDCISLVTQLFCMFVYLYIYASADCLVVCQSSGLSAVSICPSFACLSIVLSSFCVLSFCLSMYISIARLPLVSNFLRLYVHSNRPISLLVSIFACLCVILCLSLVCKCTCHFSACLSRFLSPFTSLFPAPTPNLSCFVGLSTA